MAARARMIRVAVQIIKLDQNESEVDSLKFFKEHHWFFFIKLNDILLLTSHNFGESFKEIIN